MARLIGVVLSIVAMSGATLLDYRAPLSAMPTPGHFYFLEVPVPPPESSVDARSLSGSSSLARCGDGTPFSFAFKRGTDEDLSRIAIEFMGGGACWNDETCRGEDGTSEHMRTPWFGTENNELGLNLGTCKGVPKGFVELGAPILFETAADALPIGARSSDYPLGNLEGISSSWSYVFVPDCTQDFHLGLREEEELYGSTEGNGVYHRGGYNAQVVMDWIYDNFSQLDTLVVTGCGTGAAVAPAIFVTQASSHYESKGDSIRESYVLMDSPTNTLSDDFVSSGGLANWEPWDLLPNVVEGGAIDSGSVLQTEIELLVGGYPDIQFGVFGTQNDATATELFSQMNGEADEFTELTDAWLTGMKQQFPGNFHFFFPEGETHCQFAFTEAAKDDPQPPWIDGFLSWIQAVTAESSGSTTLNQANTSESSSEGFQPSLLAIAAMALGAFALLWILWLIIKVSRLRRGHRKAPPTPTDLWLMALTKAPVCFLVVSLFIPSLFSYLGYAASGSEIDFNLDFDSYLKIDSYLVEFGDAYKAAQEAQFDSLDLEEENCEILENLPQERFLSERRLRKKGERLELFYQSREDESNVFARDILEEIKMFEESIMAFEGWEDVCYQDANGDCAPFESVINFFYRNETLIDIETVLYGFLITDELDYVDKYFSSINLASNFTRTTLYLRKDISEAEGRDFLERLHHQLLWPGDQDKPYKYPNMIYSWANDHLAEVEAHDALVHDAYWSGGTLVVVGVLILLKIQNVFIFLMAMAGLVLAFPAAYYWYIVHYDTEQITLINVSSLFVMLGIGADDIFLMVDAYSQTKVLLGPDATPGERMKMAYRKAGSTMLVSSTTTAVCFYSNVFSVLLVVREFGVFMGTVVILNYFHVMTILPSAILVNDKYILPFVRRFQCRWWPWSTKTDQTISRSLTMRSSGLETAAVFTDESEKEETSKSEMDTSEAHHVTSNLIPATDDKGSEEVNEDSMSPVNDNGCSDETDDGQIQQLEKEGMTNDSPVGAEMIDSASEEDDAASSETGSAIVWHGVPLIETEIISENMFSSVVCDEKGFAGTVDGGDDQRHEERKGEEEINLATPIRPSGSSEAENVASPGNVSAVLRHEASEGISPLDGSETITLDEGTPSLPLHNGSQNVCDKSDDMIQVQKEYPMDLEKMNVVDRWFVGRYAPFIYRRRWLVILVSIALTAVLGSLGYANFEVSDGTIVLFKENYNLGRVASITDTYLKDFTDITSETTYEDPPSPTTNQPPSPVSNTAIPTQYPSIAVSSKPSFLPSEQTYRPSSLPSPNPTSKPVALPTLSDTASPTKSPVSSSTTKSPTTTTTAPNAPPTMIRPTREPSSATNPPPISTSKAPTAFPTKIQPTRVPTQVTNPTPTTPSKSPTLSPNASPEVTGHPTRVPSDVVTEAAFDASMTFLNFIVPDSGSTQFDDVVSLLENLLAQQLGIRGTDATVSVTVVSIGNHAVSESSNNRRYLEDSDGDTEVIYTVTIVFSEDCTALLCATESAEVVASSLNFLVVSGSLSQAIREEASSQSVPSLESVAVDPDSYEASDPQFTSSTSNSSSRPSFVPSEPPMGDPTAHPSAVAVETHEPSPSPSSSPTFISSNAMPSTAPSFTLTSPPTMPSCTEPCNNGGVCDLMTLTCICERGWSGDACDLPTCPYGTGYDCSPSGCVEVWGICSTQGQCQPHPSGIEGATGCVCDEGYIGLDCSTFLQPIVFQQETFEVSIVWGIEPADTSTSLWNRNTGKRTTEGVSYQPSFDLSEPEVQSWLLEVCKSARSRSVLRVRDDLLTWIEILKEYATENGIGFPVPKDLFAGYVQMLKDRSRTFRRTFKDEIGTSGAGIGGDFLFASVTLLADVDETNAQPFLTALKDWRNFVMEINEDVPRKAGLAVVQSRAFTDAYREEEILSTTFSTWLVANGVCLAIILLFTQNVSLSLIVMVTMAIIFICVMGLLFAAFSIPFGPIQAIGVTIFIGLSANYSLHIVHAYHRTSSRLREEKVQRTIFATASPITASAVSTIAACAFLLGCRVWLFVELGAMLCSNTAMALIFSMLFLLAVLSVIGPLPIQGKDLHQCDFRSFLHFTKRIFRRRG